jgi:hypothetical protein
LHGMPRIERLRRGCRRGDVSKIERRCKCMM